MSKKCSKKFHKYFEKKFRKKISKKISKKIFKKKISKKILKFSTKHFTNLHVKKISFWGGLNNFLPKKLDFSPQNPFFVSKNFLCAIFLKSCYNVTPIIFCHLVNKISFSELNDEIFYKRPVFTEIWFVSKTSTVLAGPCQFLDIFHNSCKNQTMQRHIDVGAYTKLVHFVTRLKIQDGRHGQTGHQRSKIFWVVNLLHGRVE